MQKKILFFLIVVCIASILCAGCVGGSASSKTHATTPATAAPPSTLVNITHNDDRLIIIDITNKGVYDQDYMAVVNFYDDRGVKIDSKGTKFPRANPGETVRAVMYPPSSADTYKLDGIATTINGKVYKIEYTLI